MRKEVATKIGKKRYGFISKNTKRGTHTAHTHCLLRQKTDGLSHETSLTIIYYYYFNHHSNHVSTAAISINSSKAKPIKSSSGTGNGNDDGVVRTTQVTIVAHGNGHSSMASNCETESAEKRGAMTSALFECAAALYSFRISS